MQGQKPHLKRLSKILQDRRGFIMVIGLSIVALTVYYSIIVQTQMINTVQDIRRNNDLFQAKSVAQSVSNFVSYVLNKHDAGFSVEPFECKYTGGKLANGVSDPLCATGSYIDTVAQRQWAKGNNITVKLVVKGHPDSGKASAKYASCVGTGGISTNCYGVPAPATGDAGNSTLCQAYKESLDAQAAQNTNSAINSGANQPMADIDNPCNWNKLISGSSLTDRVAIPLYYDSSTFSSTKLDDLKDVTVSPSAIKNPFDGSKNFILRVRTPCLPCYNKDPKTGQEIAENGKRSCEGVDTATGKSLSPYYCADDKRYVLDTKKDDMVVSWQITGKCGNDECGMIQFKEGDSKLGAFSAILESFINGDIKYKTLHTQNKIINTVSTIDNDKPKAKDTTTYAKSGIKILDKLKTMTKPVFSMFLSGKLVSTIKDQFVPYLEYQFLTDTPIGQAKIESELVVIVNNTFYTQNLEKAEKRPLVDFAIQN